MKLHFASAKKVDVVIEDALMLAIFVLIYVTDVCKKDLTDLNRNILRFYCNIKHCTSDLFSFFKTTLHDPRFYIARFPRSFWYFYDTTLVPGKRITHTEVVNFALHCFLLALSY